jgi:hypothetical protein
VIESLCQVCRASSTEKAGIIVDTCPTYLVRDDGFARTGAV